MLADRRARWLRAGPARTMLGGTLAATPGLQLQQRLAPKAQCLARVSCRRLACHARALGAGYRPPAPTLLTELNLCYSNLALVPHACFHMQAGAWITTCPSCLGTPKMPLG